MSAGLGLQKAGTQKSICIRCGEDGTKRESCCGLNEKRNEYENRLVTLYEHYIKGICTPNKEEHKNCLEFQGTRGRSYTL